MSTYNEDEPELRQAIESIINQTYSNLEFIIVLDNPENNLLLRTLKEYQSKDNRIKIIFNKTNIGLAKSLNKGITASKGAFIARMDADDISVLDRIEKQVLYLEENIGIDIVSTNRIDINECGTVIESNYKVLEEYDDIKKILPFGSVITHPSVMFRKEFITKVGGYRNFEAAQDYDLWLRAVSSNCKIVILEEKLLYYRIRNQSITKSNPFRQYLYRKYAKALYKQRVKYGNDSFSEEDKIKFFKKHDYLNKENQKRFNKGYEKLYSGIHFVQGGNPLKGLVLILTAFLTHCEITKEFLSSLIFKLRLNKI